MKSMSYKTPKDICPFCGLHLGAPEQLCDVSFFSKDGNTARCMKAHEACYIIFSNYCAVRNASVLDLFAFAYVDSFVTLNERLKLKSFKRYGTRVVFQFNYGVCFDLTWKDKESSQPPVLTSLQVASLISTLHLDAEETVMLIEKKSNSIIADIQENLVPFWRQLLDSSESSVEYNAKENVKMNPTVTQQICDEESDVLTIDENPDFQEPQESTTGAQQGHNRGTQGRTEVHRDTTGAQQEARYSTPTLGGYVKYKASNIKEKLFKTPTQSFKVGLALGVGVSMIATLTFNHFKQK